MTREDVAMKAEQYGTTFVFLGLSPDGSVTGLWNDEKILRVWSTVFTNLGVPLAPETPYIPNIDLYDGDAFHNGRISVFGPLPSP